MESTNIKTSTIKFVETGDTYNNGSHTFFKYTLHLENGEKPEFLAKNKATIDNLNVGDTVRYEYKKNSNKFASLVREFNFSRLCNRFGL